MSHPVNKSEARIMYDGCLQSSGMVTSVAGKWGLPAICADGCQEPGAGLGGGGPLCLHQLQELQHCLKRLTQRRHGALCNPATVPRV